MKIKEQDLVKLHGIQVDHWIVLDNIWIIILMVGVIKDIKMENGIKGNKKEIHVMDMDNINIWQVNILDFGLKGQDMVLDINFLAQETIIKVFGWKERRVDKVIKYINQVMCKRDNGIMTVLMVKDITIGKHLEIHKMVIG